MNERKSFISLENLDPKESVTIRNDFELDQIRLKDEVRKDWMHIITHILAAVIIGVFLILLFLKIVLNYTSDIPDYFISIVSVVIGFYFARSLPFNK